MTYRSIILIHIGILIFCKFFSNLIFIFYFIIYTFCIFFLNFALNWILAWSKFILRCLSNWTTFFCSNKSVYLDLIWSFLLNFCLIIIISFIIISSWIIAGISLIYNIFFWCFSLSTYLLSTVLWDDSVLTSLLYILKIFSISFKKIFLSWSKFQSLGFSKNIYLATKIRYSSVRSIRRDSIISI